MLTAGCLEIISFTCIRILLQLFFVQYYFLSTQWMLSCIVVFILANKFTMYVSITNKRAHIPSTWLRLMLLNSNNIPGR